MAAIAKTASLKASMRLVVNPLSCRSGLYAVYPSGRNLPTKVRVFIDFLLSRFGSEPYWDRDIFGSGWQ